MKILLKNEDIKSMLVLLRTKGRDGGVRILDQFELLNGKSGDFCTMQVTSYETGEWLPCELNGKSHFTLTQLYKLIRNDLAYDGTIRLSVAA